MTSDNPGLIPRGNHFTILYRNRNLYGDKDPRSRAEKKAADVDLPDHTLFILASPLLFYGVDVLLRRLPSHSHLLCVEADSRLMDIGREHDMHRLTSDPRVTLLHTGSIEQGRSAARSLGYQRFRRCRMVSLNGGYALNALFYRSLSTAVQNDIEIFWKNRMTLINMCTLWIKNIFSNLSYYQRRASLDSIRTDKPVAVTGAGESLEESLSFLRACRNELFILTVDTALPVLLNSGIEPDGIVSLESQVTNLSDFIGASAREIPVFCDLLSHPSTFRATRGPACFFLSRFAPNRLLERLETSGIAPPTVPPLGSVGVTAVRIALNMTRNRVFFTGLDFSFVPGKTHSRGTPYHTANLTSCTRLRPCEDLPACLAYPGYYLEDKAGRKVKTTLIMDSYRTLLSSLIADSHRVFDIGRYGLPVDNAPSFDPETISNPLPTGCTGNHGPAGPVGEKISGNKIIEFLERERGFLTEVYRLGNLLLRSATPGDTEEFSSAVDSCDYLLLHFPDPERIETCDRSFIARVCATADYYITHLDRAVRRLTG